MDRRADLQLRLQKTVEGLSVVAIRQHAVFLAGYLINPFATVLEVAKGTLTWAVTLPIFLIFVGPSVAFVHGWNNQRPLIRGSSASRRPSPK